MQQRIFNDDFDYDKIKLVEQQVNIFCGIKEPEK